MDQGFRKLAGNLDQWRHRLGPLREFFASRFGEGAAYIRQLGEELIHTKDNATALSKINALAAMMPKESERREFYDRLGLDPNLARLKGKELTDALAEVRKNLKPLTAADIAKGLAAENAFDKLRESMKGLSDTIGSELAPTLTRITNTVGEFVAGHGDDLRKLLVEIAHDVEAAPWKEWGDDIRAVAKRVDDAVQAIGGWKVAFAGLIGLNILSWLTPIITSVGLLIIAALKAGGALAGIGTAIAGLTAPAWLLALLAGVSAKALIETVRPQPLNKGEDELARQKKYGLAPKDEEKSVHAAARSIRKKISAPEDEPTHYGRLTPISYGGKTDAASFGKEDAAERAILKGTFEGTRQGVIAAFKEWVESRRQGEGGFTNANYQPGASGGIGDGSGGRNITKAPAATTPHSQTPEQGATPRVQSAPTTTPAAPSAPHGTTPPASRSEPSEAAAARAMKDFADGGAKAGSLTELINEEARRAGIDPRIMQGIRAGESGHKSTYDKKDDALESSWGPFQLNRRRGTGTEFEKETGLDVRDPSTIPAQVRWVANYLRKKYAKNPNYSPYPNWQGYKRPRDADPHWGESGYHPSKEQAAKRESHPAAKGMNEWIEQQRGAHPDQVEPAPKHAPSQAFWVEKGGHVVGQHPYLVGEKGPELFVPRDSGEVIPHHANYSNLRSKIAGLSGSLFGQPHRKSEALNINLMQSARQAEMVHTPQKVVGDASLKISLHGFPKGTKTQSQISGLFKTLTMYRGLAAPMADQEGY